MSGWVTEWQLKVGKAVGYLRTHGGDVGAASRAADQAGDVLHNGHWHEARERLGLADDRQGPFSRRLFEPISDEGEGEGD